MTIHASWFLRLEVRTNITLHLLSFRSFERIMTWLVEALDQSIRLIQKHNITGHLRLWFHVHCNEIK